MQVIETLAEGLKREIKVVIPAKDMQDKMNERLADVKDKVRINGFRPGKVPAAHLKKVYGKSIMADLVNEIVREQPAAILSSRGEKSATQPEIAMAYQYDSGGQTKAQKTALHAKRFSQHIPQYTTRYRAAMRDGRRLRVPRPLRIWQPSPPVSPAWQPRSLKPRFW